MEPINHSDNSSSSGSKNKSSIPTIQKFFYPLLDSVRDKLYLQIITFLEYNDVVAFRNTNRFFRTSLNKRIIKAYAIKGFITDKTRRLYYYSTIDIKKTSKLILNELTDYNIADNFYSKILKLSDKEIANGNKTYIKVCDEIGRDITRTFYTEKFVSGEGKKMLNNILRALAFIRPEIGYCQGMNFIAGALLEFLNEEKLSFYIFLSFIDNIELNLLYLKNMPDYSVRVFQLEYFIKKFFPKLSLHFKKNSISPDIFFSKWILTIFASYLPFSLLYKIWDVFILDKWKAIFKFSMSLFAIMHDKLLGMDLPSFSQYFRSNKQNTEITFSDLAKHYTTFKITNKQLNALREEFFSTQVQIKLNDPHCEWDQDQNEFVDLYKAQLEKHKNETNMKILGLKLGIEKVNREYEDAYSSFEHHKDISDSLKLKIQILIETKEGYETVLKNNFSDKEDKRPFFQFKGSKEKEKILKELKNVNKELEGLNKQMMDAYKSLDKRKYKLEKLEKQRGEYKQKLDDITNHSLAVQKGLLRNLSQKLKLSAKFVSTNQY